MIFGIGIDIVEVKRFEESLAKTPELKTRLFVGEERNLKPRSLAARFAAKEALMKAVGEAKGLSFQEVEIVNDKNGKPSFDISKETKKTIELKNISSLHLSLSHDGDYAIAYVIAECA
ncbi:MAG: holo-ACP synthase [Actinomycetota bacterium]